MVKAARARIAEEITFDCEHCGKGFRKESTLMHHTCEQRRRYDVKESVQTKIALQAFQKFYRICQPSQPIKDWKQFSTSSYYQAFQKFARYMIDTKCVNISAFVDFTIKKNIKLDKWAADSTYDTFLKSYIKTENAVDATLRSLDTARAWSEEKESVEQHYFRYAGDNKIVYDISRGRISPWIIFCSDTGKDWIAKLTQENLRYIYDWIDPEYWQKYLLNNKPESDLITEILTKLGM